MGLMFERRAWFADFRLRDICERQRTPAALFELDGI